MLLLSYVIAKAKGLYIASETAIPDYPGTAFVEFVLVRPVGSKFMQGTMSTSKAHHPGT